MKKTRILSLVLAALMICTVFTGCTGGKTVMKIEGVSISEDVYAGALKQADAYMQQSFGISLADYFNTEMAEGQTGVDFIKEQADGFMKEFESARSFGKAHGITLDAEDKKAIEEQKKSQIESAGGRKAFMDQLEESGMNEAFFDYFMEAQQLYYKVYSTLFIGEGEFAPTADRILEEIKAGGYNCIKHVLVKTKETDADYQEKKALAEDIEKRAKAGEDFDALIAEYGEDPGMETYTHGYIMNAEGFTTTGSQMVQSFIDAANSLSDNGVSGIVPSEHGLHILKKYPMNVEYINANLDKFTAEFANSTFMEKMSEHMETMEIEYTKAYENFDVHKLFGVEKGAVTSLEDSHEGHDHGEEAPEEDETPAEGAEEGIEEGSATTAE